MSGHHAEFLSPPPELVHQIFHGMVTDNYPFPTIEPVNEKIFAKVTANPASALKRAGLLPRIIGCFSSPKVEDNTIGDELFDYFCAKNSPAVHASIVESDNGELTRVLHGQSLSTGNFNRWHQFPDGSITVENSQFTYNIKFSPSDTGKTVIELEASTGMQDIPLNKFIAVDIAVDSRGKEYSKPSWLSALVWCAAATDLPLDYFLLASGKLLRYTDPQPNYVKDGLFTQEYIDYVENIFRAGAYPIDAGLPNTGGGVAVKLREVVQSIDLQKVQRMPDEFKFEIVKDIIRAMHFRNRKDIAEAVTEYFNNNFSSRIGFKLEYNELSIKGSVILAEELQPNTLFDEIDRLLLAETDRSGEIPDYLALLLSAEREPIVRQIPLEHNDRK